MSGHRSFDELRARTPERRERIATYEQALRAGLRLREVRTRLGLSQRRVAERMDVSQEGATLSMHMGTEHAEQ